MLVCILWPCMYLDVNVLFLLCLLEKSLIQLVTNAYNFTCIFFTTHS